MYLIYSFHSLPKASSSMCSRTSDESPTERSMSSPNVNLRPDVTWWSISDEISKLQGHVKKTSLVFSDCLDDRGNNRWATRGTSLLQLSPRMDFHLVIIPRRYPARLVAGDLAHDLSSVMIADYEIVRVFSLVCIRLMQPLLLLLLESHLQTV